MIVQDAGDFPLELLARDGIQRAKGLVHQQNIRIERKRPRQPDALLHAAGNFVRIVARKTLQADEAHEALGALGAFGRRKARNLQAEGDVFRDGQPRKQVEVLKYDRTRRRRTLHALARTETVPSVAGSSP